jgi:XTP/dITP diphosphohydrolase
LIAREDDDGAMTTLLIATRNVHKVGEIRAVLGSTFHYQTLADFPQAPVVLEDASTFAGNAAKKAVELAAWITSTAGIRGSALDDCRPDFVLADDSGLEVDALQGAPGIHSARFAALDKNLGSNASDQANNSKLLRLLTGVPLERRTARFRCVIALTPTPKRGSSARPGTVAGRDAQTGLFEGVCEGHVRFEPRGKGGFGYDPLFMPAGYDQTFAELGESVKNHLSHRAAALSKLHEYWLRQPPGAA